MAKKKAPIILPKKQPISYKKHIAALHEQIVAAQKEINNSHLLIACLASRAHGAVVLHDQEMANMSQSGQLSIHRDEKIPGCIIIVRAKPQPEEKPN